MTSYEDTLRAEASSWVIANPAQQREKLRRERMRHHRLVRDLLLDKLDTETMDVLEVGGGPLPVSDLIPFTHRVVVDPLTTEYRKIAPCPDHVERKAEDIDFVDAFDLAIATNSLDHVDKPRLVVAKMTLALSAGGFLAILCAENNALTHPHPAHVHNLNAEMIKAWTCADFEVVHELTYQRDGYRYGHVLWNGRRGQPAFALLLRKCTGYK